MAEYTLLNGEQIYTKQAIDRQVSELTSAITSETQERQTRDEEQEAALLQETTTRGVEDGKLDVRLVFLETLIGKDELVDPEGHRISIHDFYEEFLKECRDRRTEDENIEEEFERYLKYHGPQELVTKYEQLKELPWIAYRDSNGRLQIKELHGSKDKPFDLTHIFTLTSYEQLERQPWLIFKDPRGRVVKKRLRGGEENALDLSEFAQINDYDELINRPYFKYRDEHGQIQLVEIVGGPDNPVDLTQFAGVSVYNDLMGKPWIKYKDSHGTIQEHEILGGQENAIDLTELAGISNYNLLDNAPTINGIETQNTVNPDAPNNVELNALRKGYDDSAAHYDPAAVYDDAGVSVPVNEIQLVALKDEEIEQLYDEAGV